MTRIDPVSTAREGLQRAEDRLAKSAQKVAEGDISADTMVQTKLDANDVRVQQKNLKLMLESEDSILDIIG